MVSFVGTTDVLMVPRMLHIKMTTFGVFHNLISLQGTRDAMSQLYIDIARPSKRPCLIGVGPSIAAMNFSESFIDADRIS